MGFNHFHCVLNHSNSEIHINSTVEAASSGLSKPISEPPVFFWGGLPGASILRTAQIATDMTESCGFVWFPIRTSVQWAQKVKVCGQSWGHFSLLGFLRHLLQLTLCWGFAMHLPLWSKETAPRLQSARGRFQEGEQSLREGPGHTGSHWSSLKH